MIPIKKTYGIIIVFKESDYNLFLILQKDDPEGSWSFPKGHMEENETPKETALRELKEETGITDIKFIDTPLIHEEYKRKKKKSNEYFLKTNDYFVGFVKDKEVKIQKEEVYTYKWATYEEALSTFGYESRKEVLRKAQKYIKSYESRK